MRELIDLGQGWDFETSNSGSIWWTDMIMALVFSINHSPSTVRVTTISAGEAKSTMENGHFTPRAAEMTP